MRGVEVVSCTEPTPCAVSDGSEFSHFGGAGRGAWAQGGTEVSMTLRRVGVPFRASGPIIRPLPASRRASHQNSATACAIAALSSSPLFPPTKLKLA